MVREEISECNIKIFYHIVFNHLRMTTVCVEAIEIHSSSLGVFNAVQQNFPVSLELQLRQPCQSESRADVHLK